MSHSLARSLAPPRAVIPPITYPASRPPPRDRFLERQQSPHDPGNPYNRSIPRPRGNPHSALVLSLAENHLGHPYVVARLQRRRAQHPYAAATASTGAVATRSCRHQKHFNLDLSLKTWGSHRILRCTDINRAGKAIATARRSLGKLVVVEEKAVNQTRAFRYTLLSRAKPLPFISFICLSSM